MTEIVFERFTDDARRTVALGVRIATELRSDELSTEHLLIAVAGTGSNVATGALIASGFDPIEARADLARGVPPRGGDLAEADAEALRTLGVDLDEVRHRTEAAFGVGALDRRARWYGRRRSRVCGLPFAPEAKKALELALREAVHLGHHWIGPEHVLLGIVRSGPAAARPLVAQGVDLGRLRTDVVRGLRRLGERGA